MAFRGSSYERQLALALQNDPEHNEGRLLAFANHIVEFEEGAFDTPINVGYIDKLVSTWLVLGLEALRH
jgi:hypothetical protein